jgi:tetratricopeptide (TPR) repeat protein
MSGVAAETIDYLFSSSTANSQAQRDSLANTALSQGINFFQNQNYDRAINAFKRSAGLSYGSDNSATAYDYIAKAYLAQDKTDDAVKTYKQAIKIYPQRDDFHLALGDIYMKNKQYDEATGEYEAAVRLNPDSTEGRYSLGQLYVNMGRLNNALKQFEQVVRLSPGSATGYYGLGQVSRASGDYQQAIAQLEKSISVNKNFGNSYLELGYTYIDMGNLPKAEEQVSYLSAKGAAEATTLRTYISAATQGKIIMAHSSDGFNTSLGAGTFLSTMDTNLIQRDSQKYFSMDFMFSKTMDAASVQDIYNWGITRATIAENGGVYNNGLTSRATEVAIIPIPTNVSYSPDTKKATVQFMVTQNSSGNATIDPRHIVFKFYGIDAYGKTLDKSGDEYSGFSSIA